CVVGIDSTRSPSTSYATQTGTFSSPERMSNLVKTRSVIPLTCTAYRPTTASNQPHRRSRPVVVPYSRPALRRYSPSSPSSSVGNGPDPTRVVYALATPITRSIAVGGTPVPTQAPAAVGLEEVT